MTRPDPRPVLLVTSHAPPERGPAFAALHAREGIELCLFGGAVAHGSGDQEADLSAVPHRRVEQRAVHALAASGRYRAVVCATNGRIALPAAWSGARRAGVPLVLWASLWAHPRSAPHAASWLPTQALYVRADAVAAYGPHVAAYVRARGARRVHLAPQNVDAAFWRRDLARPRPRGAPFVAAFAGRVGEPGKGLAVLLEAWRRLPLSPGEAELVLVGPTAADVGGVPGVRALGPQPLTGVRDVLAGADVVVVPSVRTATFREPWSLTCNEAMHLSKPLIATTEVGAVAGGLVRHGRNATVVPAGDAGALAGALFASATAPRAAREALGAAGARDVAPYTPQAWAAGLSGALRAAAAPDPATP